MSASAMFRWFRHSARRAGSPARVTRSRPPTAHATFLDVSIRQLPRMRELRKLLAFTTRLIVRYFGAGQATVYLEAASLPGAVCYRLMHSHGSRKPSEITQLDDDSPLVRWLRESRRPLQAGEHHSTTASRTNPDGFDPYRRLGFVLENLHAHLVVPSFHGRHLLGFLALGPRAVGRNGFAGRYTDEEIGALTRLAESWSIAVGNTRGYEQLKATAQKLHSAQERLVRQERMVASGRLAMGLAHEIKNPLAAIKTFTELLPERYDQPEFRKEFTQVITHEVDRISRIVQSLSDFAKPLLLKIEPVDVQHVLKETLALLSNDCLKRNVRVRSAFDSSPIFISADAGQLKQVFLNLCMNALEAMPTGGQLSASCVYHEGQAVVRLLDTGAGIPKEHLPALFDPFFTTKDNGMGLGLALVKQIVEQHFGSIHVESTVGTGTVFEIRLPWAMRYAAECAAPSHPPALTIPEAPSWTAPVKLLVVDDEPKTCTLIQEYFNARGCRVRAVASGEEALEALQQDPPQLVLLDLKLEEGMDGFEVLTRMKQRTPSVPVIIISGHLSKEAEQSLRELGAVACLHKPINLTELQRHVIEAAAIRSSSAG